MLEKIQFIFDYVSNAYLIMYIDNMGMRFIC